jgi:polyhydroxyalkanoate synthesis repressor PhaR
MATTKTKANQPTVIKKYANRRLYDTGRSSYVTLSDLSEMVREGHEFVVKDAKTGEDITRSVLAQIILDQESQDEGNGTLLPTSFMRKLISFYGGNMQALVPNYLESSMEIFAKNQEKMQEHFNQSLKGMSSMQSIFPASNMLEEINKQNIAMMERTMKMLNPFGQDK